jgi:TIR domain
MRVFLAWSGTWSQQVAHALRTWLRQVIQSLDPFMSEEDISKGSRWPVELAQELEHCDFGVICLTPENVAEPWIHFEAGALSKLSESRVAPFLLGLGKEDVVGPLVQFQACRSDVDDVLRLLRSINENDPESTLDDARLKQAFERWWPDLKASLDKLTEEMAKSVSPPERRERDMLVELLETGRGQTRTLTKMEHELRRVSVSSGLVGSNMLDVHRELLELGQGRLDFIHPQEEGFWLVQSPQPLPPHVISSMAQHAAKWGYVLSFVVAEPELEEDSSL